MTRKKSISDLASINPMQYVSTVSDNIVSQLLRTPRYKTILRENELKRLRDSVTFGESKEALVIADIKTHSIDTASELVIEPEAEEVIFVVENK